MAENKEEKNFRPARFFWARRNLAKPTSNPHKISVFAIRLFAYLDKEYKKTEQIYQK